MNSYSRLKVIAEETTEISPIIEVTPDSTSGEGQLTEEATTAAETEARKMFKYM